jgi:hypothetical protein
LGKSLFARTALHETAKGMPRCTPIFLKLSENVTNAESTHRFRLVSSGRKATGRLIPARSILQIFLQIIELRAIDGCISQHGSGLLLHLYDRSPAFPLPC